NSAALKPLDFCCSINSHHSFFVRRVIGSPSGKTLTITAMGRFG
ncbi:MAG: hypothetical protein ACI82S_002116, partial [Patiriisocius sp.]